MGRFDGVLLVSDFDNTLIYTEDALLRARNKWLVAHPESAEAADGAFAGLTGENIDISADI